ncbi:TCR/Tet family MFS transporter [Salmonella enterica]|nr:TCR/Tet family MFS transporter [Salmonella enterica]
MGSCAAPSAKGDDKFITTDYLQQCPLTSLTSIVGPLLFTAIYAASITTWNGWAWIAGAALYLLCLPALRRGLWRNSSNSRCT